MQSARAWGTLIPFTHLLKQMKVRRRSYTVRSLWLPFVFCCGFQLGIVAFFKVFFCVWKAAPLKWVTEGSSNVLFPRKTHPFWVCPAHLREESETSRFRGAHPRFALQVIVVAADVSRMFFRLFLVGLKRADGSGTRHTLFTWPLVTRCWTDKGAWRPFFVVVVGPSRLADLWPAPVDRTALQWVDLPCTAFTFVRCLPLMILSCLDSCAQGCV